MHHKHSTAALRRALLIALLLCCLVPAAWADTGYLLVTPDRGFLGNQEAHDAFAEFAEDRNAALLYVTDERSEAILDQRLATLKHHGATDIVVLPLVLSAADARWQRAAAWIEARRKAGVPLHVAAPYGASYLAVEDLAARLRSAQSGAQRLLLVGYGAADEQAARQMTGQLETMAGFATNLDADAVDAVDAVVWPLRDADGHDAIQAKVDQALAAAHATLVVPVAFAPRDDSMMAFGNWLSRKLPKDATQVQSPIAEAAALAQWMTHAARRATLAIDPPTPAEIGVIVLAHGADWFWNQTIEKALAPVGKHHQVAFAFSMADQPVVARAVRQLEEDDDVRAAVLVRVFAKSTSFLPMVQRMLGLDVAAGASSHGGHHGMMVMHGAPSSGIAAAARIRSALPIVTVGGVDDSPLMAKALLHNARAVSRDAARETVILVAHGNGADAPNNKWLALLDSLAGQFRADGGDDFRAVRTATWREDWPKQREQAVAQIRKMVEEAHAGGGRALVIPARINGRGHADRYLTGLDYGWGQGFVQTPYFAPWFETQVRQGISELTGKPGMTHATMQHDKMQHDMQHGTMQHGH